MCKSMTKLITSLDEDPSGQLGLSVGCVWRGGAGRGGARYRCYELWDQLARLSYRINICKHHQHNEKITDGNVFSFTTAWDILEFMQQVTDFDYF